MPQLQTGGAEVLIDGAKIDDKFMKQLLDVQVRDSLLHPDTALVRMRDPEGEYIDTHPFQPGKKIEIKMGPIGESTVSTVFQGDIVALEPEFLEGDCVISARAYDRSYKLNLNRTSRTFQNQTAEDMIKQVGAANGLTPGTVKSTGTVHPFFQQSMETDWQFCWRLATMNNYEFVVQDEKFHFRPREMGSPVATLEWGSELLTFKPRMSGMGQAKNIKVANNDPKTATQTEGEAATPQVVGASKAVQSREQIAAALGGGDVIVADRVANSSGEAKALAQSVLDRMAGSFVEADGKAHGNPKLRAGVTIKTDKVGPFSGEYVLTQTTHTYRGGTGYTTGFVISGRSGHGISDLLRGTNGTSAGAGGGGGGAADWAKSLVIGIVTNNNDPEKMGRVRVKFPALGGDMEGWWARVATLNAGPDRGMFMLPQVNDEVVVGFEHDDPRRPFVLGSLYTGKDKPPEDLMDAAGRKARFGVKSDESVHVEAAKDMTLRSKEKMVVEVNGGPGDYSLDAKGKIDVKAGQSVTIKAPSASITVEAQGALTLKGATVDIEGSGAVNIKGSIINVG
jgi:phage protein D/phage baseplate assembly protein gpV